MEHLLALYAKPHNPLEPVLCFDEKSKQLLKDTKAVKNTQEGTPRRRDYEYERNGTRNIFVTVEPKGGYRTVTVTARRKKPDFAKEIRRITDLPRYTQATTIHIVLDNLTTHGEQSFLDTFGEEETKNIMRRIRFHYTPKHASWLNMAEIEIGILSRQCVRGRVPTEEELASKIAYWQNERNREQATIDWKFTVKDARTKMHYADQQN